MRGNQVIGSGSVLAQLIPLDQDRLHPGLQPRRHQLAAKLCRVPPLAVQEVADLLLGDPFARGKVTMQSRNPRWDSSGNARQRSDEGSSCAVLADAVGSPR